jgi:glycerophosphoryl diester phosphodiesterase
MGSLIKIFLVLLLFSGCNGISNKEKSAEMDKKPIVKMLNERALKVRDYMKKDMVIAHRGSTYWTPEETEPAYRWARNIGADYLELDVQLTKDSILVAFHDKDLSRTTNVKEVFPERANSGINEFTLKELRSLDAGSWFNTAFPKRAKNTYTGLKILTLQDVVMIAEGFRISFENGLPKKEKVNSEWTGNYLYEQDPYDNGNRPGIYIETKSPKPGTERILARDLSTLGWSINNNPKEINTSEGKVDIANTNGRIILQSFSHESIEKLEHYLPGIPKILLLWHPDMEDALEQKYIEAINFAVKHNVHGIGPSIAGAPNNYGELTAPWMADLVHSSGMYIHPYTFDTNEQLKEYKNRVEGVFTNRSDLALAFYGRKSIKTPTEILIDLGY